MSEKLKGNVRKIKEVMRGCKKCVPVLLTFLTMINGLMIVSSIGKAILVNICWNVAMTSMFNVNKITIIQAFWLTLTVTCLRANFFNSIVSEYSECKNIINKFKFQDKSVSESISAIYVAIIEVLAIIIASFLVKYTWNSIFPQILKFRLIHITWVQALGFAYLFHLLFGFSDTECEKSMKSFEDVIGDTKKEEVVEQ